MFQKFYLFRSLTKGKINLHSNLMNANTDKVPFPLEPLQENFLRT